MPSFRIVVFMVALAALCGCAVQKYRPAPLAPAQTAAAIESRSFADPGLRKYYLANSPTSPALWPPSEWRLPDLTIAAFYFSPTLQIARAAVATAEAGIATAAARPNPSITADLGGETAPENPWIAGVGFSLPIETAGKRRYRITEAERLVDVARWNLASTAWNVRAQLRSALLEYTAARLSLDRLQAEEKVRSEQVHLLEQRLAVGLIPRPEVDAARIQDTQALLAVQKAEGRISQSEAALSAAIGVPIAALSGLKIAWPGFDRLPSPESLTPSAIQTDAVLNRLDIRRSLAEYSASEAALQVEISKQYPDFNLGPDYAFEEGAHLFSLAAGLTLPIFNRNQGPIAEAEARRKQIAAQFLAVQAAGIAASEQALAKYKAALNQRARARQLVQQSSEQEQAAQKSLQAGEGDRVALNAAQLQTAVASVAELDAVYAAQQALGDLENAVERPLAHGDIEPLSQRSPLLQPGLENAQGRK